MKFTAILFAVCILFSSCFSYKKIDLATSEIIAGKKYKIVTLDSSKNKGKVISTSNNSLSLQKKGPQKEIPFSEIETIKIRKFSYLKTVGIFIGVVGVLLLSYKAAINIPIGTPNIY